jgi:hypothetical protein
MPNVDDLHGALVENGIIDLMRIPAQNGYSDFQLARSALSIWLLGNQMYCSIEGAQNVVSPTGILLF